MSVDHSKDGLSQCERQNIDSLRQYTKGLRISTGCTLSVIVLVKMVNLKFRCEYSWELTVIIESDLDEVELITDWTHKGWRGNLVLHINNSMKQLQYLKNSRRYTIRRKQQQNTEGYSVEGSRRFAKGPPLIQTHYEKTVSYSCTPYIEVR